MQLKELEFGPQLRGVLPSHVAILRQALGSGAARADAVVGVQEEVHPRSVLFRRTCAPLCSWAMVSCNPAGHEMQAQACNKCHIREAFPRAVCISNLDMQTTKPCIKPLYACAPAYSGARRTTSASTRSNAARRACLKGLDAITCAYALHTWSLRPLQMSAACDAK
jgi:hypothetical protein